MLHSKKGFTLIEMLVVIAIIAVLVSVIIPVVSSSTQKAQAATDAANLRSVLGFLNTELTLDSSDVAATVAAVDAPASHLNPGAQLHVFYSNPGFIKVYYVVGSGDAAAYYGLNYLAELAQDGTTTESTAKPTDSNGAWYIAGIGAAA